MDLLLTDGDSAFTQLDEADLEHVRNLAMKCAQVRILVRRREISFWIDWTQIQGVQRETQLRPPPLEVRK